MQDRFDSEGNCNYCGNHRKFHPLLFRSTHCLHIMGPQHKHRRHAIKQAEMTALDTWMAKIEGRLRDVEKKLVKT